MTFPPVRSKVNMYKRWTAGEFGNKIQSWLSLEEFEESGYHGVVSVRSTIPGHPIFCGQVDSTDVRAYLERSKASGISFDIRDLRFNEAPDMKKLTLQGEVVEDPNQAHPLSLIYAVNLPVSNRDALKTPNYAFGLHAKTLLQHYMDRESFEWLYVLFERYPKHVIEFTCLDGWVGDIPRRNTIFWEVRDY